MAYHKGDASVAKRMKDVRDTREDAYDFVPKGTVFLPHSCGEWVIGGSREVLQLVEDLLEILLKREKMITIENMVVVSIQDIPSFKRVTFQDMALIAANGFLDIADIGDLKVGQKVKITIEEVPSGGGDSDIGVK